MNSGIAANDLASNWTARVNALPLRRRLMAGFGAILGVAVAIFILVALQHHERAKAQERSQRSAQIAESLDHARFRFANMQAAWRGFVITGRTELQREALEAERMLRLELEAFDLALEEPSLPGTEVAQLRTLVHEQLRFWERVTAQHLRSPQHARDLVLSGEGIERARAIGTLLDRIDTLQKTVQAENDANTRRSEEMFLYAIALVGVFQVVLLILTYGAFVRDATGRSAAEAKLRESEERFRLAVAGSHSGIFDWDIANGRYFVSGRLREMLGIPADQPITDREQVYARAHPDDRARARAALQRHFETREPYELEARAVHPDGTVVWQRITGQASWNDRGEPVRFTGAVSDITARRLAEEAAVQSTRELEAIFEAIPVGVALIRDRTLVRANRTSAEMFGYDRQDVTGKPTRQMWAYAEDYDRVGREVYDALARSGRASGEANVRRADGSVFRIAYHAALLDRADPSKGMIWTGADVTELRRDARLASEMSAAASIGGWELDLRENQTFWSAAAFRVLGLAPGELEPTLENVLGGMGEADREKYLDAWRAGLKSGDSFDVEVQATLPGGQRHWVQIHASVERDASGRAVRVYGSLQDIDQRKQRELTLAASEAQVRELAAELEARVAARTAELATANRELEAFSYSVSHDLRAPLRAIGGFSRALAEADGAALSEQGRAHLDRVLNNVMRMNRLIDDLLEFSRVGRQQTHSEHADLGHLARSAAAELSPAWPNAELQIGPLPVVQADTAMLRQVFGNLIGNALKYSSKREHPKVEVGIEDTEHGRAVFVRDNGAGFDMKYADRLFQVFSRLHGRDEFEGTGVGLALVRRIIERHGGRIWAESAPGEGATFRFTLG